MGFFCAVLLGPAVWAADQPVVLVAGATGETGIHIVRALAEKGFAVRGLVRDPAKAQEQNGDLAEWVTGNVREPASLGAAMHGATYVISAIGSRERDGPNNFENIDWLGNRNLIDAAKAAGVKRVVLITSGSAGVEGADPKAQMFTGRFWKGKAENYLRASGIDYTIIAPGGLRNFKGGEKGVLLRPRVQYTVGTVARPDVAAVTAECVTNPACGDKTLTIINTDAAKPGAWLETLAALPIDTLETGRGGQKADRIEE
ncbi:MAG: SDR family oxidoreductase [Rhodospirillaceae bacterium]|nr:SDR family oxidoreductase [Rhodospirillaceae bacterium]